MHPATEAYFPAVDLLVYARLLDQSSDVVERLFGAREGLFDRLLLARRQHPGLLPPQCFGGFELLVDLVDGREQASALFPDGNDFIDLFSDLDGRR
jgi:hypothetical protein